MIAGIKGRTQSLRILWITRSCVKINHGVKRATRANPLVQCGAGGLATFTVARRAKIRSERCAHSLYSVCLCALDHLLLRRDQVIGSYKFRRTCGWFKAAADVIDAFEHDQPFDTRLTQDIGIKTRQGVDPCEITEQAVARKTLIDDR